MTISKEFLQEQLKGATEARRDALANFHTYNGAVQALEMVLNNLKEQEPDKLQDLPENQRLDENCVATLDLESLQPVPPAKKPSRFSSLFSKPT